MQLTYIYDEIPSQKDKYHMLSLTHRKSHVYILYECRWEALRDTKGASRCGEKKEGGNMLEDA